MHKLMKMIGVLGAVSSGCLSQEIGLVSAEIDGWAYLPIMIGQDVDKIIALSLEASSSPINALWCWEDADGDWEADAWESASWEDVAAFTFEYIEYETGDIEIDVDAFLWPVDLDVAAVHQLMGSCIQPQPFGDGLFVGDVLEPLVQENPDILEPLETIGYSALSTMSGVSVTGGSFGGGGLDPQPKDDECIALASLLSSLREAFGASQSDLGVVDQSFVLAYGDYAAQGDVVCDCPDRDWVLSDSGWAYSCTDWVLNSGPVAFGNECHWYYERLVQGSRRRTRAHTEDCLSQICTQTKLRTGFQEGVGIGWAANGYCNPNPMSVPRPGNILCDCGMILDWNTGCETTDWIPETCPWE